MRVELTPSEMIIAQTVAALRTTQNIARGKPPTYGLQQGDDPWDLHMEGALGEMALAKAQGVYWNGAVGDLSAPDVGDHLQVRTTRYESGRLLLHRPDNDHHTYVLLIGGYGRYRIVGSILGKAGKLEQWWAEPKPGKGRWCFCVPQDVLTPWGRP